MKKGFTLTELLAVIVILAIIAVIAVPRVLGVIESSKKDAFRASVHRAIDVFDQGLIDGKYKVDVIYDLNKDSTSENKLLGLKSNSFVGGTIKYDSENKAIIVESPKDNKNELSYAADREIKDDQGNVLYPNINNSDIEVYSPNS